MSNITEKRVSLEQKLEYIAKNSAFIIIWFSLKNEQYYLEFSWDRDYSKSITRLICNHYKYIKWFDWTYWTALANPNKLKDDNI